jgi:hypothetical protein
MQQQPGHTHALCKISRVEERGDTNATADEAQSMDHATQNNHHARRAK